MLIFDKLKEKRSSCAAMGFLLFNYCLPQIRIFNPLVKFDDVVWLKVFQFVKSMTFFKLKLEKNYFGWESYLSMMTKLDQITEIFGVDIPQLFTL